MAIQIYVKSTNIALFVLYLLCIDIRKYEEKHKTTTIKGMVHSPSGHKLRYF